VFDFSEFGHALRVHVYVAFNMSSCSLSPSLFMVASITMAPISTVMPSSASRLTPSSL